MREDGPDWQTYRIRTLLDIWALRDADQMERALREIGFGMVRARRIHDDVLAAACESLSPDRTPSAVVEWPEAAVWIDDGGGRTDFAVLDAEGRRTLSAPQTLPGRFHADAAMAAAIAAQVDVDAPPSTAHAITAEDLAIVVAGLQYLAADPGYAERDAVLRVLDRIRALRTS